MKTRKRTDGPWAKKRMAVLIAAALGVGNSDELVADGLLAPADDGLSGWGLERMQQDLRPLRWRMARFDRAEISRVLESSDRMPLVINVFNDAQLRGYVQKNKKLENGSSFISGSLEDGGHFTLFLHKSGNVRGEFHSTQGFYSLKSEGESADQVLVREEDLSQLPGCGNDQLFERYEEGFGPDARDARLRGGHSGMHGHRDTHGHGVYGNSMYGHNGGGQGHSSTQGHGVRGGSSGQMPRAWSSGAGSLRAAENSAAESKPIDVLVVYTQRVEDYEGGRAQALATIENEIAKTNQALENSGLAHRRIRLAAAEKVDYEQNERDLSTDLALLKHTAEDGYFRGNDALDEVFPLIEKHQADLVHLFVRDVIVICGGASNYNGSTEYWVQKDCENSENLELCLYNTRRQAWASRRYSMSSIKCTNYVFTHELGHVLGLWHNREDYGLHHTADEKNIERGYFPFFKAYAFGYIDPNMHVSNTKYCISQRTIMGAFHKINCNGGQNTPIIPYFSNADLFFPPPEIPGFYNWQAGTPMGVAGDHYTGALDGPVNASRAIDEVWDTVAALSEPPATYLPLKVRLDPLTLGSSGERLPMTAFFERGKPPIAYKATSSDESIATTRVVNGFLIVEPEHGAEGTVQIRVEATDATGSTESYSFPLRIDFNVPRSFWQKNAFLWESEPPPPPKDCGEHEEREDEGPYFPEDITQPVTWTATSLALNCQMDGNIFSNTEDVDYFRLQIENRGSLAVWTTGETRVAGGIGRLDKHGLTTGEVHDIGGESVNFLIEAQVDEGVYIIDVSSSGGVGDYTIHTRFTRAFE